MGFDLDIVLSEEALTAEFTCAICRQLCEHPVHTTCSHVFCRSCLEDWFLRARRCPSCNTDLRHGDAVRELQQAAPLAHRILLRIRMRCPLHAQGCDWVGEYSEVHSHLTSSDAHLGQSTTSALANAEALKEQGNAQFALRHYKEAIRLYSKAISLAKDVPSFYGNRAAALYMLHNYTECIRDCGTAVELDPAYLKAHVRRAKAEVELGEFVAAAEHLRTAAALHPTSRELAVELARVTDVANRMESGIHAYQLGDFSTARNVFTELLRQTSAVAIVLWTAKAELGLGLVDRPMRLTLQVLRQDPSNVTGFIVRAQAQFFSNEIDAALDLLKGALRSNPDCDEARIMFKEYRRAQGDLNSARGAIYHRQFEQGAELLGAFLDVFKPPAASPLGAQCFAQRAMCHLRLQRFDQCLQDCARAVYAKEDCVDAWVTRANALHALGRHQEALDDMQDLMQRWGANDPQIKHQWQRADFEVRKLKRRDAYGIMGCKSVASEAEIKGAYRQRALEWHPDRWVDGSAEEKALAETKFKELGDMLELLTDPFKRQLYDEGHDEESIKDRVAAAQRAAHEPNRHHHHHH